jgi:hypothetical protein
MGIDHCTDRVCIAFCSSVAAPRLGSAGRNVEDVTPQNRKGHVTKLETQVLTQYQRLADAERSQLTLSGVPCRSNAARYDRE